MHTYIAHLYYKIVCTTQTPLQQFEQKTLIIQASDNAQAHALALELGMAGEEELVQQSGGRVFWRFLGLAHLSLIPTLTHGTVIDSCILEKEHEESFESYILTRNNEIAAGLRLNSTH